MSGRPLDLTQRRGLTRDDAAEYLGLTTEGFSEWVRRGIVPGPIPGTHRWDKKAIDAALDKASGLNLTMPTAYDKWKAGQGVRAP